MGIKYLNRFLQDNCKNSIKKVNLYELSGKKIVIDTSIYMYRYLGENVLLENIYLMISVLRSYNIIPLFVFDGKPPKEKENLLRERKKNKKEAEEKYILLENEILTEEIQKTDKIEEELNQLRKQFIRLHHKDIENVKLLIQSLGVSFIDAPGEADKLCAKMVNKNLAYACLSEDMDMFVYGCKRVLRYLSLLNKNVIMYDMKDILIEIDMNFNDFKSICIISGTDYNINNENDLTKTLKYFKKFKKSKVKTTFLNWLDQNTNYIDYMEIINIIDLFDLDNDNELKNCLKTKIKNSEINISNLKNILSKEDFIFVN
jgi:flap endonuclease-1|uniref:XPG N-terminal domain-containing protein n=1 Tax=viral metagenome TaxID=1070528 RepID=A0A6C0CII7_9ZZZZ